VHRGGLAHPGGNITGLTNIGADIYGNASTFKRNGSQAYARGFFLESNQFDRGRNVKETEPVARFLRVGIQSLEVRDLMTLKGI